MNSPPALPLRVEWVSRATLAVVLGKLLSGGGSAVAAVLTSVSGAVAAAVLHVQRQHLGSHCLKKMVFFNYLSVPASSRCPPCS